MIPQWRANWANLEGN